MTVTDHQAVIGICGYSGSGKTTLIEQLIPLLHADGLSVAVVKHDAHGLCLDTPGKDTDRFFQAGATVAAHDPHQQILRRHLPAEHIPIRLVNHLAADHDVVLVEGHKATPLPAKIWLCSAAGEPPPAESGPCLAVLARDDDRLAAAQVWIRRFLADQQRRQPLRAGLLIGGSSSRMGRPKQMLEYQGRTWAELVAAALRAHTPDLCVIGSGELPAALLEFPRLPDAPDLAGPAAGMVAALRWAPAAGWIFAACDMPLLTADAIGWLLSQRRPGIWGILPRLTDAGPVEPFGAWYDGRLLPVLAGVQRLQELAEHPRLVAPMVPRTLAACWQNLNTPKDL